MNAWTGHGFISAILCAAMENKFSEFLLGIFAVFFGLTGIAIELADRIEKRRGANRDHTVPGAS